jgi:hypothetical protein
MPDRNIEPSGWSPGLSQDPATNRPDRLEERPVPLPQLRVATATIAGIAAWVSYWHMAGVAVIRSLSGVLRVDLGFRVVDRPMTGLGWPAGFATGIGVIRGARRDRHG